MFKILESIPKIFAWLQIAVSPLVIAIIIGGIIYLYKPNNFTLIIAIVITIIGLAIGIIWASRVWKKKGTVEYMAKLLSTPKLDKNG
jgi:disulfide bond formation protein DsbB